MFRPDELLLGHVLNQQCKPSSVGDAGSAEIVRLPASSDLPDNVVKAYFANVGSRRNTEADAKELYRVLLQEAHGGGEKMRVVISADGALVVRLRATPLIFAALGRRS
jgi:hypothetical protein